MNSQFCSDSSVQNYYKSEGGNEARREDWNLILVVNLNERTILPPFTCHITCRRIFVPCIHEHMEEFHHVLNEANGWSKSLHFIQSLIFHTPDFQTHQFELFFSLVLWENDSLSLSLLRASYTFRYWNSDTDHFIHFIRTISFDMNSQKSMLEFNVHRWFLVKKLSRTLLNGDE